MGAVWGNGTPGRGAPWGVKGSAQDMGSLEAANHVGNGTYRASTCRVKTTLNNVKLKWTRNLGERPARILAV